MRAENGDHETETRPGRQRKGANWSYLGSSTGATKGRKGRVGLDSLEPILAFGTSTTCGWMHTDTHLLAGVNFKQ